MTCFTKSWKSQKSDLSNLLDLLIIFVLLIIFILFIIFTLFVISTIFIMFVIFVNFVLVVLFDIFIIYLLIVFYYIRTWNLPLVFSESISLTLNKGIIYYFNKPSTCHKPTFSYWLWYIVYCVLYYLDYLHLTLYLVELTRRTRSNNWWFLPG